MARSATRRRTARPPQGAHALVLDADGLSKAAAGDPAAIAWIARARELSLPIVVNAVTLTETLRGSRRDAHIHLLTRNAHVDSVDPAFATDAGTLLGRTKRNDTIDALVAVTAIRLDRPAIILTSDPNDLSALTAGHDGIEVRAI
jgi:predicted nucleic acid-binding protein